MRRARDLERRLEHLMEGLAGRVFRGQLHPSEFGARMVREADLAAFQGEAGPTVPNSFSFLIHSGDLGEDRIPPALEEELALLLEATAAERGWRLEGPAAVSITPDQRIPAGTLECHAEAIPGRREPWARLEEVGGGRHLPIRHNRSMVGRAAEMDLVLSDPEVSRCHALLWREGDHVWVMDLGSSNGTRVDGAPADHPAPLYPGSVVSFGSAKFTFRSS